MGASADASDPQTPGSTTTATRLVALLREDNIDAAIDAGLMDITADDMDGLDPASRTLLIEARQRLQAAWDARERYRARETRQARRKAERDTRRTPPPRPAAPTPTLPAAAAAALARAKARAGTS
ncbi:MAG TPA: hypothetical protein PK743_13500 [Luteimonas sp.]|nr:hypothetical protein [Luteimonas sp.]HRO26726.1 hypothetical protein [Luteimonas sp.]HRP73634.1 hypothetical protein [Luteimonas sp.]